jgi:HEAT repeat protein
MTTHEAALTSVIRHAAEPNADHDDIAPTVAALAASRASSLLPRLHEALDRFLDEENFYGRDLIAEVLAGIAGTAALPALLLAAARDLGDDQDGLRAEITEVLHADPAAGRRAVLDLVRNGRPGQRRAALLMLGAVAEPGDAELLAEAAAHADREVRRTAIEAIPDRLSPALVAALGDPDEQVRLTAVGRLGAVPPLAFAATDPSRQVRARVAYALGMLGDPEATPALLRLLDDPEEQVRDKARDALGAVGGPAAVDALLNEAAGPDPRRRAQAAKALPKALDTDPRVVPALLELAADDEPAVRAATLSGLATADSTSGRWASLVADLTRDPDPGVRQRVAVVAGHLAPAEVTGLLQRLAEDPVATVREVATTQLNRLAR